MSDNYLDKDKIRENLSLAFVCHQLGIPLDANGKGHCPWHDDRRPSFHLYTNVHGVERFACSPCDISGDVFDFIQLREGCGFMDSLLRAEELLDDQPEHITPRRDLVVFDHLRANAFLAWCKQNALANPGWVGVAMGLHTPEVEEPIRIGHDLFITGRWRIGVDGEGNVIFPHYDYGDALTGIKFRARDGRRWTWPGSRFPCLYGGWRPRAHRNVLLCEGETDFIYATLQDPPVDVLALPSGAGKFNPDWTMIEADIYYLGFDNDEAGREATGVWKKALDGRNVKVIELPEGEDLRSSRLDIAAALW